MKRVVIADDSTTARIFVKRCLEIAGMNDADFAEATNGREALELMKKNPPDLLVTDLTMPDMDGTQLVTRVSASPVLNGTPIMVISSHSNPAVTEELKKLGACAVLQKPVSPGEIAAVLETIFWEDLS